MRARRYWRNSGDFGPDERPECLQQRPFRGNPRRRQGSPERVRAPQRIASVAGSTAWRHGISSAPSSRAAKNIGLAALSKRSRVSRRIRHPIVKVLLSRNSKTARAEAVGGAGFLQSSVRLTKGARQEKLGSRPKRSLPSAGPCLAQRFPRMNEQPNTSIDVCSFVRFKIMRTSRTCSKMFGLFVCSEIMISVPLHSRSIHHRRRSLAEIP